MRAQVYAAGSAVATTHQDFGEHVLVEELLSVEVDEYVYRIGDTVEVAVKVKVVELCVDERVHLIKHHCKNIAVTVLYVGRKVQFEAHPAWTIEHALDQAIKELGIAAADASDLVLRVHGQSEDLPSSRPVGAYVPKGSCDLSLDLCPLTRPQG